MSAQGQRILVTGGTGFIGGRLVETLMLRHQEHVRVVVRDFRRAIRLRRFNVELISASLTDTAAMKAAATGCDVVYHSAFGSSGDAEQQRSTTVEGTRSLLAAAKEAGVKRFVNLSTLSVYGDLTTPTLDETAPRQRTGDLYGDTKLDAEELVLAADEPGAMRTYVLQPTVVYGPFGGWWTAGQINRLKQGRFALANDGTGICNPVYVDDVVQAMLRAAQSDDVAGGQSYLISGPQAVSWREYYSHLERMVGRPSIVSMSPDEIIRQLKAQRPPRGLIGWALQVLRERHDVRQRIVNSPLGLPYRLAVKLTPTKLIRAIKRRILGENFDAKPPAKSPGTGPAVAIDTRPIILPDLVSLPQFTSPTRVSIEKARKLLAYQPQYDLARGMTITEQWARWASLV